MSVQSVHTYEQVSQARGPWWRLDVSNWGNRGAGADSTSISVPTSPTRGGAAAIVIGPDSTADQVLVNYTDPVPPPFASLLPNPGAINQLRMTCGVGKPFYGVPGPFFFTTSFSTMFTDLYFKDGVAAAQPFGTANPAFEAPYLQLLTYIQPPPSGAVPQKRNDMYRVRSVPAIAATEVTAAIWPVMGRRRMAVNVRADNTLVANVRIGGIVDIVNTSLGVPSPVQFEDTLATAAGGIDATTGVQFGFENTRPIQWIAVYATQTAGAGNIIASLIARDD
jgi:hypothetical protein